MRPGVAVRAVAIAFLGCLLGPPQAGTGFANDLDRRPRARTPCPACGGVDRADFWSRAAALDSGSSFPRRSGGEIEAPPQRLPSRDRSAGVVDQPFVDRLDVSLVLVPTLVRDARGKPVMDLRREDFTILDEGEPREIVAFGFESREVSVVLALDTSPSMEPHEHPVKGAALEFVRQQREDTAFALVTFKDGVFLDLDFTKDRRSMENAIAAARIGGDATALLDTLAAVSRHLETREGARVAVVFTDGTETVHPMHEAESRLSAGIDAAVRRDVSAYTVAFGPRAARGVLRRLADETGGEALVAATRDDLSSAFARIAEAVGSRYLLGFKPPDVSVPGFRSVQVSVSRPGLSVVARRRYAAQ